MSGGKNRKSGSRPQAGGNASKERKDAGTAAVTGQAGTAAGTGQAGKAAGTGQGGKAGTSSQWKAAPGLGTAAGAEPQVRFGRGVGSKSASAGNTVPSEHPSGHPSERPAERTRTEAAEAVSGQDAAPSGAVRPGPVSSSPAAGQPVLQVEDINVYYGSIHAIKGISFEVREGEIVTLIGANGAGKSTTLNTVAGLLRSRTGSISFLGENLGRVPCHKVVSRGLALVPEGRRIFLQMTVQENLEMGAYTQSPGGIEADLEKVYHYFPRLQEREKQIAGTLSGGEQQMLAMGRALMSHPKLLMLDEPSMGLAPILVEQIFEIIRNLHKAGSTILLVEQNARAALSIADRGYVLETGKIVTAGRGRDLLESPEIKKAYLGG